MCPKTSHTMLVRHCFCLWMTFLWQFMGLLEYTVASCLWNLSFWFCFLKNRFNKQNPSSLRSTHFYFFDNKCEIDVTFYRVFLCKAFFTFSPAGLKDCRTGLHGLFTPLIALAKRSVGVKLNLYSLFCAHYLWRWLILSLLGLCSMVQLSHVTDISSRHC